VNSQPRHTEKVPSKIVTANCQRGFTALGREFVGFTPNRYLEHQFFGDTFPKVRRDISEKEKRGLILINLLIQEGLTLKMASGIVGNISQESDIIANISGRSGVGLCQWCGYRKNGLKQFAKIKKADWFDVGLQAKWIVYELKEGSESEVYPRLVRAETVEDVASLFCDLYERPSRRHANKPYRISQAKHYYSLWEKERLNEKNVLSNSYLMFNYD
jgi:hypothetical protein